MKRIYARCGRLWVVLGIVCITSYACTAAPVLQRNAERLYHEGQTLLAGGNSQGAYEKFTASMGLAERAGYRAGIAHNLNEMAIIHTQRGEYAAARTALNRAVSIYTDLDLKPEVSKARNNLALTYFKENRFQEAIDQYELLLGWDRQIGNRLGEAIVLNQMGWICANFLNEPRRAYALYSQARDIFAELGKTSHVQVVEKNIDTLLKQVAPER